METDVHLNLHSNLLVVGNTEINMESNLKNSGSSDLNQIFGGHCSIRSFINWTDKLFDSVRDLEKFEGFKIHWEDDFEVGIRKMANYFRYYDEDLIRVPHDDIWACHLNHSSPISIYTNLIFRNFFAADRDYWYDREDGDFAMLERYIYHARLGIEEEKRKEERKDLLQDYEEELLEIILDQFQQLNLVEDDEDIPPHLVDVYLGSSC